MKKKDKSKLKEWILPVIIGYLSFGFFYHALFGIFSTGEQVMAQNILASTLLLPVDAMIVDLEGSIIGLEGIIVPLIIAVGIAWFIHKKKFKVFK